MLSAKNKRTLMKFAAYFGLAVVGVYILYGAYQDSQSGSTTFANAAKARLTGLFQTNA